MPELHRPLAPTWRNHDFAPENALSWICELAGLTADMHGWLGCQGMDDRSCAPMRPGQEAAPNRARISIN